MRSKDSEVRRVLNEFKKKEYYDPWNVRDTSISFDLIHNALTELARNHQNHNDVKCIKYKILAKKVVDKQNHDSSGSFIPQFDRFLSECEQEELEIFAKIAKKAVSKPTDVDDADDNYLGKAVSPTPRNNDLENRVDNSASPLVLSGNQMGFAHQMAQHHHEAAKNSSRIQQQEKVFSCCS